MSITFTKILATLLLLTATIAKSQPSNNQISRSQVENSTILQGDNSQITKNYFYIKPKKESKVLLKELADYFTDSNADRALRNKKYRLAADILQEAYETAIATKSPKKNLLSILSKKSIAEGYFDKIASYNTLQEALKLDKQNLLLREAAANTAIDIYQFDSARVHLHSILNNKKVQAKPYDHRRLRFDVNHRLHAISALERRADQSVNYAIICSKIFRMELNEDDQNDLKLNQVVMLQVAILAAAQLTTFPTELISEYLAIHKIVTPKRNPSLLGTDKEGVWISISEQKPVRIEKKDTQFDYNIFEDIQETPSYIMGEALESIIKPILDISTKEEKVKDFTERDMLRYFLTLQEDLIEITSKCKECAIFPIGSSMAPIMIATFHENVSDSEAAHFYYSLALRKLQKANSYLRSTPHYRFLLSKVYQKIGVLRAETIGGIGTFANEEALQGPFRSAIKIIEDLTTEQSSSTDFITKELELRNLYSGALLRNFNFREAKNQCIKAIDLFRKLNGNAYSIDNDVIASYLGCTRTLLVSYKIDNELEKYESTKKQFIESVRSFNPTLNPELLLGGL